MQKSFNKSHVVFDKDVYRITFADNQNEK